MICIVGFLIFAFLGIFSATYRRYTLDAWECIKSKASAQPCETNFDERYRAFAVDQAMKIDIRLARFVKNYFEELNWVIFVTFGIITVFTLEGAYNLLIYGSCDPSGGCVIEEGLRWLS